MFHIGLAGHLQFVFAVGNVYIVQYKDFSLIWHLSPVVCTYTPVFRYTPSNLFTTALNVTQGQDNDLPGK